MSTKSTIQALIDANLADGSSITASEHRAVENSLLNELYPNIIFETRVSNSITTENTNSQYLTNNYEISIVKHGRLVTITGRIINGSVHTVSNSSNSWFFEISNSEYIQADSTPSVIGVVRGDITGSFVTLTNNRLFCNFIAGFTSTEFQLTYYTQN